MRMRVKKIVNLLMVCSLLASTFLLTGCASGGEAVASSVRTKLILALNNLDYDAYYNLAYPALREDITKEKDELGLSDKDYMQHIRDELYPFDYDTMISESSLKFTGNTTYDAEQLKWINDEFIYYDDYVTIDSAKNVDFLIRDYKYTDETAPALYRADLVIVSADSNYYFVYFSISDTPYEEDATTPAE